MADAKTGDSYAQQGRYPEAIQAYLRAVAANPNLTGIYLNLGLAYFKLGDFRKAASAFEKENARAPSERVSTLLAMSDFGLGNYRQAADRLKPIAAAQPDNTELSYLLAKCYLWAGRHDDAKEIFRQLLQRDANSPAAHMLLGEAFDADGRTADAVTEYEAAASAAPAQPDVHFGLGYLYWKQKRYAEAERHFRQEIKNDPQSAASMAYLGDIVMKNGSVEQALPWLKNALRLRSDLHVAHVDLAIYYADHTQYDAAVTEFRRAIDADPSRYDAHYRLARLYRKLGRMAEADLEFEAVRKLHEPKTEEPLMRISGPNK